MLNAKIVIQIVTSGRFRRRFAATNGSTAKYSTASEGTGNGHKIEQRNVKNSVERSMMSRGKSQSLVAIENVGEPKSLSTLKKTRRKKAFTRVKF